MAKSENPPKRRGPRQELRSSRSNIYLHLIVAAVSWIPLLLTRRGDVVADTKQYLFLDPSTMLESSGSLWDPDWALGTVTHQSIGYLWPMAPFFAATEALGLPMWAAQRMWLGSILFGAMSGMLFLSRRFGWRPSSQLAAALFYGLSPYALAFTTRLSVLILPWAGLPWLLGLAMLALHRASDPDSTRLAKWRDPARLALVTTTVGAINASSLIYVGVAVIVWFPYATFSAKLATLGQSLATMIRIGAAQLVACAWWIVALGIQGSWGPDVLRFSETLEAVASGSPASEAWRSTGFWIFYGGDRIGSWVTAGESYTQNPVLMTTTFVLGAVGLASLLFVRWAHRSFMIGLALCALLLTIGLHPYGDPSPIGSLIADGAAESTLVLALRSSPRAMPLYLVAVACSFAAGLDALTRLRPHVELRAAGALIVLVAAAIPSLWTGGYVGEELARPEEITQPWQDVAAAINADDGLARSDAASSSNQRVLILPGADFSAHRWGNTIDHILPGLVERPVAVRELIPFGSAAAADLLIALDRRGQERILEPQQIGPIATLLGAGDIVVQGDLEYERYRTPRPDYYWSLFTSQDADLGEAQPFGPLGQNRSNDTFPMLDEVWLATDPTLESAPELGLVDVADATGILRTKPEAGALIVVGDAESLLELAGAGGLANDRVVLFEASLSDEEFTAALQAGATVVITDGHRLRARRWKSVRDNLGITEMVDGDGLSPDPTDARLDVFGDIDIATQTVSSQTGVVATATSYGNSISYHPEDRGAHAVDGDPLTAWRTGAFTDAKGESLRLAWDEPVPARTLTIVQPQTLAPNRTITEATVVVNATISFDLQMNSAVGSTTIVDLNEVAAGQLVDIPIETIEFEIVETSAGRRPGYGGLSGVGVAEIWLDEDTGPGTETILTPRSIAERPAGTAPADVQILVARERVDAASPVRDDPELAIEREVAVPWAGTYSLTGTVRLSGRSGDAAISSAVGQQGDWLATTTDRVTSEPAGWAGAILDDDPSTRWHPPFGTQVGQSLTLHSANLVVLSSLSIDVVEDEAHSSLLEVTISNEMNETRTAVLAAAVSQEANVQAAEDLATLEASFESLEGSDFTVTISATEVTKSIEWYSASPVEQPVGIAEIRPNGQATGNAQLSVSELCRDDLLLVNGEAWPVKFSSDAASALQGQGIELTGCTEMSLPAGTIEIQTADRSQGWTIDRLFLSTSTAEQPVVSASSPVPVIVNRGRSSNTVELEGASEPYWLVLAESFSEGWEATVIDGVDLGPASLVDGFANGWLIDPAVVGNDVVRIELEWVPNGGVRSAIWFSAIGCLILLLIALWPAPKVAVWLEAGTAELGHTPALLGVSPVRLAGDIGWALLIGFLTKPILGVGALIAMIVCRHIAGAKRFVELSSITLVLAMGAYVTVLQIRYGAPHDGAWPSLWNKAHVLGLTAIVGLWVSIVTSTKPNRPTQRAK